MSPGQYIPAIRHASSNENKNRQLDMVKWGYFAPFRQLIVNARVEEASEKRTYKSLINTNRAVMIAEGYFEWTPKKTPFLFKPKPEENKQNNNNNEEEKPSVLFIAGIVAPDETFILFTRESFDKYGEVHDRMPVLLDESEIDMWLDCKNYRFEDILFSQILDNKKAKWSNVDSYQVGPLVNNTHNDSVKVIMKLDDYKKDLDKTGIKKFFQPTKKEVEKKAEPQKFSDELEMELKAEQKQPATQSTQATSAINNSIEEEKYDNPFAPLPGRVKTDAEVAEEQAKLAEMAERAEAMKFLQENGIDRGGNMTNANRIDDLERAFGYYKIDEEVRGPFGAHNYDKGNPRKRPNPVGAPLLVRNDLKHLKN